MLGSMVYTFAKSSLQLLCVVLLVLALAPGLPPTDVTFEAIPLKPNVPLTGPLRDPDHRLSKAEIITSKVEGSNLGYLKVRQ